MPSITSVEAYGVGGYILITPCIVSSFKYRVAIIIRKRYNTTQMVGMRII